MTKLANPMHLTLETRLALYAAIRANVSKHDVCSSFGICERSYYYHREIAMGKRAQALNPVKRMSVEQRTKAFAMHEQGATYLAIALSLSVSQAAIFRLINRSKHYIPDAVLRDVQPERVYTSKYAPSTFILPLSKERLMAGR